MNYAEMKKKLKKAQDKERYEHTKGVMYTASCLAMAHGYDIQKAMVAGLLHDCAKCIPNAEKLSLCKEHNIHVTAIEAENPFLLHAKLGAFLAETEYDITDPEIIHAIKVHTTGEPDMSTLDKIIYIADYIEPNRDLPGIERLRMLAYTDLDAALKLGLNMTLEYLARQGSEVSPESRQALDWLNRKEECKC